MTDLTNKVALITGSSRGIGRTIALRLAKEGARIVVVAKTTEPHPTLPGTIHSVVEEIEALGGEALAIAVDVRDATAIETMVSKAVSHFGGIDMLVNNASAIQMTSTEKTPSKRFDLMMAVNMRATFLCSQACIPHLRKADNPHILTMSPPLAMHAKWFKNHLPYTMSKYGMSMCTLGMAEEFKGDGIAVNSLWPLTTIATSAIKVNFPQAIYQASRHPEIVAEAAYYILKSRSCDNSGNFFIDEEVLRSHGITDFSDYAINADVPPFPDLFLELNQA